MTREEHDHHKRNALLFISSETTYEPLVEEIFGNPDETYCEYPHECDDEDGECTHGIVFHRFALLEFHYAPKDNTAPANRYISTYEDLDTTVRKARDVVTGRSGHFWHLGLIIDLQTGTPLATITDDNGALQIHPSALDRSFSGASWAAAWSLDYPKWQARDRVTPDPDTDATPAETVKSLAFELV